MDSIPKRRLHCLPNQWNKKTWPTRSTIGTMGRIRNDTLQDVKTIHIDHKGPLRPSSNANTPRVVVVDAFSRFPGAYSVRYTGAQTTIDALEKWITLHGIPQKIVHDNGSGFINIDFSNWTNEFGITFAPGTT